MSIKCSQNTELIQTVSFLLVFKRKWCKCSTRLRVKWWSLCRISAISILQHTNWLFAAVYSVHVQQMHSVHTHGQNSYPIFLCISFQYACFHKLVIHICYSINILSDFFFRKESKFRIYNCELKYKKKVLCKLHRGDITRNFISVCGHSISVFFTEVHGARSYTFFKKSHVTRMVSSCSPLRNQYRVCVCVLLLVSQRLSNCS